LKDELPRIAAGDPAPSEPRLLLEVAWVALVTGDAALARRLFTKAHDSPEEDRRATPDEATRHRVVASVLLAGSSAPDSGAAERSLRNEAHRWLRDRLDEDRQPAGASVLREVRVRWLRFMNDPRLSSVRDAGHLAAFPDDDRREWSLLWEDARRFLADT
jgi:hypothetical protein